MGKKRVEQEKNSLAKNLPLFLLVLVLSLLPLVMYPYSSDMYALPKATFLYMSTIALLSVYVSRAVKAGKLVFYRSALDVPVTLMLITVTVSLLLSDNPLLGLVGRHNHYENLPAYLCYSLIYFLSVQLIRSERDIKDAIKALTIGLIPVIIYGLAQVSGLDFSAVTRFGSRIHSSLGNPILLGAYLVIMIPLLLSVATGSGESKMRSLARFLIIFAIISLAYTGSRGAWIGLIAAAIAMAIQPRKTAIVKRRDTKGTHTEKNKAVLIAALAFVVIAAITLSIATPAGHFGQQLASTFDLSKGSIVTRIETWNASLEMISDRPLRGFGLEQMGYWFPIYKTARHIEIAPDNIADRAHNDLLQVAIDIGIPGMLLYVWMFTIALLGLLKSRKAGKNAFSAGLLGALIGYIAQAQTGMPAVFIVPIVWALLAISATISYPYAEKTVSIPRWIRPDAFAAAIAIVAIGLTLLAVRPVIADSHIHKGEQLVKSSIEQAAPEFEAAISIFPYQTAYGKAASEFYLYYASHTQNSLFAKRAALIAKQGLRYNKRDFELAYYAGEANLLDYKLAEDELALERAEEHYRLAERLWPGLMPAKRSLFEIATIKGDLKSATARAKELIKMKQENPELYYILAVDARGKGEHDRAERYLKKIKELDPNFLAEAKSQ